MIKPRAFSNPAELRRWFAKNHATVPELWLQLYKKDTGIATVTYAEALDEALCYGWIDAVKKSYDADSWIQRFCPRSVRSRWSKINVRHVERLTRAGRMASPGLAAVRAAKESGRWETAYDSSASTEVPEELLTALKKSKQALDFFKSLDRANLYAITYRIQTAKKPATRDRWIARIVKMLENREVFHPKK
jgi:uncharacterized protein YdeI (YjbR/CyaY-like superfamily)